MVHWQNIRGSTCCRRIGWEPDSEDESFTGPGMIHVWFLRNKVPARYVYRVASKKVFDAFKDAGSRGRYYVHTIKARYHPYKYKY